MNQIKLIILSIFIFSCACHKRGMYYDTRLKIKNNSTSAIVSYYSYAYPDTSLSLSSPYNTIYSNNQYAQPNTTLTFSRGGTWDNAFTEQIPSGKLEIFIIDKNVFDNIAWDSIRKNYKILKRYNFTLQELQNFNWNLQYP